MKRFEITQNQLDKLLDASKPTPVMYLTGGRPMFNSPQENANIAWKALGDKLGFDYITVRPILGQPQTTFEAEEIKDA